jgi:hypothetical protein
MTEQAALVDQEIRAFVIKAVLAGRDPVEIGTEAVARWGLDAVPVIKAFGEEVKNTPLSRADRRRLKLQRRKH